MTTNNNSKSGTSSSTGITAAKPRTVTRKAPVAERVTVSAAVAVPQTGSPATPASPTPATPASPTAGAPTVAGSSAGGGAPVSAVPVGAPPAALIPAVPTGFVPVNPLDLKGFRPMASEVAAVPDAVTELQGFTGYTSVFGITAPDATQLTQRLNVAFQWTMLLSQTAAWYKYAKSQQGMAWKDALVLIDALKAPFALATTANPALLSQYPALGRLLGAQSVVAKRAASSRAKGLKTKASNASTAPITPAPAPTALAAGEAAGEAAPNGGAAPVPTRVS